MQTIGEAARTLGLTHRQLRRRIRDCRPLLGPYIQRGDKNKLLLNHNAIELLRAIEDRRATGATTKQAIDYVQDSIKETTRGKQAETTGYERELIETLQGQVADLRKQVSFLREQLEHSQIRALPAPARWLSALFPARFV